ncbi:hypothetical protein C8R47DRAFT_1227083 [Mycena vitilis]|nr:hypothetical protein C8R47DRAFT_1227083 [Mycena vitilis]
MPANWTYSMSVLPGEDLTCPPAPRIPFIPLPGPRYVRLQIPDLFPIELSRSELPAFQFLSLFELIPPSTTIVVEDISRYVLFKVNTGRTSMTTADFVEFLQFLSKSGLPSYTGLSPNTQRLVGQHFISRHALHGHARWYAFANGRMDLGVPTGEDLLLGRMSLLTFGPDERNKLVATVDVPRQPQWR